MGSHKYFQEDLYNIEFAFHMLLPFSETSDLSSCQPGLQATTNKAQKTETNKLDHNQPIRAEISDLSTQLM